jgi:hypothetical protein
MSVIAQPSPAMPEPDLPPEPPGEARGSSLLQVISAVSWSFFGIRKRAAMSRDTVTIKPQHVIVVGIVLAAIFVLTLVALVQFITRGA